MAREGRGRIGRTGLLVSAAAGGVVALLASLALSGSWHTRTGSLQEPHPAALTSSTPVPVTTTTRPSATTAPTTTAPTTTKAKPTSVTTSTVRPAPGVSLDGCPNLPADNIWHAPAASLPVLPDSAQYVAGIGADAGVKADFGSGVWDGGPSGIPVTYVSGGQRPVPVTFGYADESDPGPYPVPADAAVEGGANSDGDRHVLVVDTGTCTLSELYNAHPNSDGSWHADSGAVYHLTSDQLPPMGLRPRRMWTSRACRRRPG